MVKIKGLQTAVGSYGILKKGKVIEVKESLAKMLAKEGIAEIISEDDGEDREPVIRGGVRIKDASGQSMTTEDRKITKKDTVIKVEDPAPEKKAEPAEEPKKEVKETPKKEYQTK